MVELAIRDMDIVAVAAEEVFSLFIHFANIYRKLPRWAYWLK